MAGGVRSETVEVGQKWKHVKTGGLYEVVCTNASLQCSTAPEFEGQFEDENWVIYKNVRTGFTYIRLLEEFCDGRFEMPQ